MHIRVESIFLPTGPHFREQLRTRIFATERTLLLYCRLLELWPQDYNLSTLLTSHQRLSKVTPTCVQTNKSNAEAKNNAINDSQSELHTDERDENATIEGERGSRKDNTIMYSYSLQFCAVSSCSSIFIYLHRSEYWGTQRHYIYYIIVFWHTNETHTKIETAALSAAYCKTSSIQRQAGFKTTTSADLFVSGCERRNIQMSARLLT